MSTSGVKILENDIAHDTYEQIIGMYDKGVSIKDIEKQMPMVPNDNDAYEKEMYVVAYGLAMWDIGNMTDAKRKYIKSIIDKEASVQEWRD